jgi:hypothetical protein
MGGLMKKRHKLSFKDSIYIRLLEVAEKRDLEPLECLYTLVNEERDRLRGLSKKSENFKEDVIESGVVEDDFDIYD